MVPGVFPLTHVKVGKNFNKIGRWPRVTNQTFKYEAQTALFKDPVRTAQ